VSGSNELKLKRWEGDGIVLQTFSGHSCIVSRIIEMKSGVVFTSSLDTAVAIWNGDSTEEDLLNPAESTYKTMKLLSQEKLLPVQISTDKTFHIWNSKGECIETVNRKRN